MTFVKICGLTRPEDVEALPPVDAAGFVLLSPKSPRNLPLSKASRLVQLLPGEILPVVVTVERSLDRILEALRVVEPSALQLHSPLDSEGLASVRREFPHLKVIHRFVPALPFVLDPDFWILDRSDSEGYGGTGRGWDWNSASRIVRNLQPKLSILAGGLSPYNVGEALRLVRPFGVDVSSGVESSPGVKDPRLVKTFLEEVRRSESEGGRTYGGS